MKYYYYLIYKWNHRKNSGEIWHFIQIMLKLSFCPMETKYPNMPIWPNYPFQNIFKYNIILLDNLEIFSREKKRYIWYLIQKNCTKMIFEQISKLSYCPMETKYWNLPVLPNYQVLKYLKVTNSISMQCT